MNRKRILMLLALLLWMALIFWFSEQNGSESSTLSKGILRKLLSFSPDWDTLSAAAQARRIAAVHLFFRKVGHFTEYAVLGAIAACTMRVGFVAEDIKTQRARYYLIPAGFALLYAAGDEIHQIFVPGRTAHAADVLIDFAGACTGVLLTAAAVWLLRRRMCSAAADSGGIQ